MFNKQVESCLYPLRKDSIIVIRTFSYSDHLALCNKFELVEETYQLRYRPYTGNQNYDFVLISKDSSKLKDILIEISSKVKVLVLINCKEENGKMLVGDLFGYENFEIVRRGLIWFIITNLKSRFMPILEPHRIFFRAFEFKRQLDREIQ